MTLNIKTEELQAKDVNLNQPQLCLEGLQQLSFHPQFYLGFISPDMLKNYDAYSIWQRCHVISVNWGKIHIKVPSIQASFGHQYPQGAALSTAGCLKFSNVFFFPFLSSFFLYQSEQTGALYNRANSYNCPLSAVENLMTDLKFLLFFYCL